MKIAWSKAAKFDYWKNIEFLEEKWTEKEVIHFVDEVEFVLNQLQSKKVIFKSSAFKNTFQVPILNQVTLFYMKKGTTLTLLRFWNNYKDMERFNLK